MRTTTIFAQTHTSERTMSPTGLSELVLLSWPARGLRDFSTKVQKLERWLRRTTNRNALKCSHFSAPDVANSSVSHWCMARCPSNFIHSSRLTPFFWRAISAIVTAIALRYSITLRQISDNFSTWSRYLLNEARYRRTENGVANCTLSREGVLNSVNFGPQKAKNRTEVSCCV